jgi:hypothetical protein
MTATMYRQAPAAAPLTTPRRWWARRPARLHFDRPVEVLAVLEHARAIIETGWVQNRWTVERGRPTAQPSTRTAGSASATPDGTVAACVVGAVALAVRARNPQANLAVDTAPALAVVWDAVHSGSARPAAGRAAPHAVRVARMRDLARWNDQQGRTRDEVVALLDRAAARVVAATVEPAR